MKYDTWKQYSCMHFDLWETAFSIIIIILYIQLDLVRQKGIVRRSNWKSYSYACSYLQLCEATFVLSSVTGSYYTWNWVGTDESYCIMKTLSSRPNFNSKGYSPQYWGLWAIKLKVNLLPFTQLLQRVIL